MKQKRIKPRPTRPKGERWPFSSEDRASLDDEDWAHDCEKREYKKSEKHKQGQQLADKFKKKC